MHLNNLELSVVVGGAWTSTFLNSISRFISTIYNLGYAFGSSIKRVVTGTACKL